VKVLRTRYGFSAVARVLFVACTLRTPSGSYLSSLAPRAALAGAGGRSGVPACYMDRLAQRRRGRTLLFIAARRVSLTCGVSSYVVDVSGSDGLQT